MYCADCNIYYGLILCVCYFNVKISKLHKESSETFTNDATLADF